MKKTGRNDFQKYDYFSESDVVNNVKPLLKKHGVCITSSVSNWSIIENNVVEVVMVIDVTNVDNKDDQIIMNWIGHGRDVDKNGSLMDKGIAKAITATTKQAISKLFLIAEGFDPEDEQEDYYNNTPTPREEKPTETRQLNRAKSKEGAQQKAKEEKEDSRATIVRPMDYEQLKAMAFKMSSDESLQDKISIIDYEILKSRFETVWGEDGAEETVEIILTNLFGKTKLEDLNAGEALFMKAFISMDKDNPKELRNEVDIEIGRCYEEWGYYEEEEGE